ncbi:MAG: TetR/AcrR family transcriptional regulator [Huintestinicola sp.]|uniref:TetR/AcrR family transcriptional regulator n=1 Tax=Huintestinicola sp. TaxID=2981661 RepID=UPI003F067CE0
MKKDEKLGITKEKLRNAAAELMNECSDCSEVTSRAIAERAGVRLSMINYCFGSREALLFEAFSRNEKDYRDDPRIKSIICSELSPKEKLRKMHYAAAEFLIKEYKFTKAVTGYVLLHRDLSKEPSSLPFIRAHFGGRKSEEECRVIAYELSSMMQLVIYRLEDFAGFSGLDLRDSKQLHRFIDMRIDMLLGE